MGVSSPGFKKKRGEQSKPAPVDWSGVFTFLRINRGLSRDEILDLTAPQLLAELADVKTSGKPLSRTELAEKATAKRDQMFARICAEDRITPLQLSRLAKVDLVSRVRRFCGGKPVDETLIPAWADDFSKRTGNLSPCP